MKPIPSYEMNRRHVKIASLFMIAGAAAVIIGFSSNPERVWANLLLNNYYVLTLGLAAMLFLAITYLAKGHWAVVLKRIPEAVMANLPVTFVIMIFLCFGLSSLYHWTDTEAVLKDPILLQKQPYLNVTFFIIRMLICFGAWILFAYLLRRNSLKQDNNAHPTYHNRRLMLSAAFIVCFGVTFTIASYDWLMSLEPHWYSTMFSFYTFSSLFLHGLAALTLITIILMERGHLEGFVNKNHLHDLGKMMFGFSTLWGYIWYSQFLLIWYTNMPEESEYFYSRMDKDWLWLFLLSLVLNWFAPFLVLMSRGAKRSIAVLKYVSITLLIGYWLDLYIHIMPAVTKKQQIGFIEIFTALGFAALFYCVTSYALSKAPIIAKNDPHLEASINMHQ